MVRRCVRGVRLRGAPGVRDASRRALVLEDIRRLPRELQPRRARRHVLALALLQEVAHAAAAAGEDVEHVPVLVGLLRHRVEKVSEGVGDRLGGDRGSRVGRRVRR